MDGPVCRGLRLIHLSLFIIRPNSFKPARIPVINCRNPGRHRFTSMVMAARTMNMSVRQLFPAGGPDVDDFHVEC